MAEEFDRTEMLNMTVEVVSSYVANNPVPAEGLQTLLRSTYFTLNELGTAEVVKEEEKPKPAVSVRSSVKSDHITCLVCGKRQKTLKRHLRSAHDMSPEDYRQTFNLPADYPMVAPEYAAERSEMAKRIGLGSKGRAGRGRRRKAG